MKNAAWIFPCPFMFWRTSCIQTLLKWMISLLVFHNVLLLVIGIQTAWWRKWPCDIIFCSDTAVQYTCTSHVSMLGRAISKGHIWYHRYTGLECIGGAFKHGKQSVHHHFPCLLAVQTERNGTLVSLSLKLQMLGVVSLVGMNQPSKQHLI